MEIFFNMFIFALISLAIFGPLKGRTVQIIVKTKPAETKSSKGPVAPLEVNFNPWRDPRGLPLGFELIKFFGSNGVVLKTPYGTKSLFLKRGQTAAKAALDLIYDLEAAAEKAVRNRLIERLMLMQFDVKDVLEISSAPNSLIIDKIKEYYSTRPKDTGWSLLLPFAIALQRGESWEFLEDAKLASHW